MKILFVDAGEQVQERWVEPLRAQGWGVIRARSEEDASAFLTMHGSTLKGLAVHESFAGFAAKTALPYVVLTEKWSNAEVQKNQKSSRPAAGCIPHRSDPKALMDLFTGKTAAAKTGTQGPEAPEKTRTGMRLVEANGIYGQPEGTRSGSLSLKSPLRVLGGGTSAAIARDPAISESAPVEPLRALEPVPEEQLEPSPGLNPVRSLEPETQTLATRSTEDLSFEDELSGSPLSHLEDIHEAGAEVLDFEGLTRAAPAPSLSLAPAVEPSPDLETLKSYLTMREQDVAVLSGQLRSAKDRAQQLELAIKAEKARSAEIQEMLAKAEAKLKNYDLEKQVELEVMNKQIEDMSGHLKEKTEKARVIETKLRLVSEEVNKVKERVRVDIRRIRVREKELEGQLEILKKDSGALLQARDEKILELKRRIDLLEFNMELVQEQYDKERKAGDELRLKLKDAAEAMKQANGFLEQ